MTHLQEAFFKVNVRLALVNWTLNYGLRVKQKVCDVAAALVQDKVALSIYYTGCSLNTVFLSKLCQYYCLCTTWHLAVQA